MTELVPIQQIEIDVAFKTPRQDEDEDDFKPNEVTSPDHAMTTSLPKKQVDVILTMVIRHDGETDDEHWCRQAFIRQQLKHHETGTSSDTDYFIKFVAKKSYHHPEMNQISPLEEFTVFLAYLKDLDTQRMIHNFREG